MGIIAQFGKLASQVTPVKGDSFNEFWEGTNVPADVPTKVLTLAVPATPNTKSYFVTRLYVTGRDAYMVELKKAGVTRWKGRGTIMVLDLNPTFEAGEVIGAPGELLELFITHGYTQPLTFNGNVFGFMRKVG